MSHTVTTFADLMPAQAAPAPTFWAHIYLCGQLRSFLCRHEAEFLDVADLLDACTIELYEDGSMVLRHCAPLPDVVPGVYPLPLTA